MEPEPAVQAAVTDELLFADADEGGGAKLELAPHAVPPVPADLPH